VDESADSLLPGNLQMPPDASRNHP
jgi:hypothetical protein